jgi:hypothetical protein
MEMAKRYGDSALTEFVSLKSRESSHCAMQTPIEEEKGQEEEG